MRDPSPWEQDSRRHREKDQDMWQQQREEAMADYLARQDDDMFPEWDAAAELADDTRRGK